MPEEAYYVSETPVGGTFKVTLATDEVLGERFKIEQPLGEGRLSVVYRAYDSVRSESIALKVVGTAKKSTVHPLMEELRRHSSITNYSHVIRAHEIHPIPYGGAQLMCVAMELADGGSLRDWLRQNRGKLSLRRSQGLEYFRQACAGVSEVHAVGLVHGDLKPENLLLKGNTIKVADFSLSRALYARTDHRSPNAPFPTGTAAYMS